MRIRESDEDLVDVMENAVGGMHEGHVTPAGAVDNAHLKISSVATQMAVL